MVIETTATLLEGDKPVVENVAVHVSLDENRREWRVRTRASVSEIGVLQRVSRIRLGDGREGELFWTRIDGEAVLFQGTGILG